MDKSRSFFFISYFPPGFVDKNICIVDWLNMDYPCPYMVNPRFLVKSLSSIYVCWLYHDFWHILAAKTGHDFCLGLGRGCLDGPRRDDPSAVVKRWAGGSTGRIKIGIDLGI